MSETNKLVSVLELWCLMLRKGSLKYNSFQFLLKNPKLILSSKMENENTQQFCYKSNSLHKKLSYNLVFHTKKNKQTNAVYVFFFFLWPTKLVKVCSFLTKHWLSNFNYLKSALFTSMVSSFLDTCVWHISATDC